MLDRYGEALHVVSDGGLVSLDAAQLALHLALNERLNGAGGAGRCVDQRDYERLNDQIGRLNDWLAENAVDLYQEPDTDTAEAMIAAAKRLAASLASVRRELAAALDERNFADRRCAELEAERDGLRQQVAQLDADDSALIARIFEMENEIQASQKRRDELNVENLHLEAELERLRAENAALIERNGKSMSSVVGYVLSEAAHDYLLGLEAGRWKWRQIPKQVQVELVRYIIAATNDRTQSQFDACKPAYMPTATAHVMAFNTPWLQLVDFSHEVVVGK
ncbi:MAG: hypothetical protein BroJett021_28200 [Chloroflexota bacterium]|nr:MAG: hypothetical protein BroJett021_28200 [Chloroflexota bacterium]